MLLRFRAGNHLSLREPQELSMVASRAIKGDESGLIDSPAAGEKLVPAAIIYGANASGKSNVVDALRFMRWQVLYSHNRSEPSGPINRAPFALDPKMRTMPSVCDIDFVIGGVRYHYGFEALDTGFSGEWLEYYPSGKRTTLFKRVGQEFKFGRSLRGQKEVIRDLTRSNSLFLSTAVQNNHEQLTSLSAFFREWTMDEDFSSSRSAAAVEFEEHEADSRTIDFLRAIGTGVVGFRKAMVELSEERKAFQTGLFDLLRRVANKPLPADVFDSERETKITLGHRGAGGDVVQFELERESAGTTRLLVLLQRVFRALDECTVMVIDELDASLHTQACEAVVALFCSPKTNPKGAQLIATTHDTNLLRSPLIRRDQIWFTEKDEGGATHLYPLTDIATRQGDNLEKGYLQGRFGAIPFAGSAADIIAAE